MFEYKPVIIGLSIPICFGDMAKGKVNSEKVALIFSNTTIVPSAYDGDWNLYIECLRDGPWMDEPWADDAELLLRAFIRARKVFQPCIIGRPPFIEEPAWVNSVLDIKYNMPSPKGNEGRKERYGLRIPRASC